MHEKIYYYSKRKLVLRMIIASVILFASSSLVLGAISSGQIRKIGLLVFVGIVGLGAALFIVIAIPLLLSKAKKEIELNSRGIFSTGNNGASIGLIPWNNISNITKNKIENRDYVCVHVHDISPFSNKITTKENRALLASNHIALLIDNKNVGEDLSAILNEGLRFLKIYGAPVQERQGQNNSGTETTTSSFNDLKVPVLDVQVFMHYDSGVKGPKNFEDPAWVHEHVFFWPFPEKSEDKSLPPGFEKYNARHFVFTKPLPDLLKLSTLTAVSGNEVKHCFTTSNKMFPFGQLFKSGHLKYIKHLDKRQHVFYDLKKIYAVENGGNGVSSNKEIILSQAIASDSVHLFEVS